MSAVVYPLSGRLVSFLLFPMANALCLVPWLFLAVERLAAGERSGKRAWTLLAALAGLQLLAGHPETAFFTALACGIFLLARGAARPRLAVWTQVVSAWSVGLLLSGVALVPLAFTVVATDRWRAAAGGGEIIDRRSSLSRLRFVLPNAFGQATDGSFWGAVPLRADDRLRRCAHPAVRRRGALASRQAGSAGSCWTGACGPWR